MYEPGSPPPADLLTRRAALARAAWLLGGALSAPTVAGVLAGCGGGGDRAARPAAAAAYQLRALTGEQARLVAAVGETILPETDTPGARSARVHEFVDEMLAEFHTAEERGRVTAGLARLDARARRRHGRAFAECTAEQQFALVDALDRQAFGDAAGGAGAAGAPEGGGENAAGVAAQRDPATRSPNDAAGHSYTAAAGAPSAAAADDDAPDPADAGPKAFFRTLKELVVVGYYTSEAGATRELRVNPMGRFRADVPYAEVGRAWA